MLRSLYLLLAYAAMFGIGVGAPFVLTLGFVWVDFLRPGDIVYSFLRGIPYSMLMGAAAIGAYLIFDRRAPPRVGAIAVLTLLMAAWITMTCFWAVLPDAAWNSWSLAIKSILFSVFVPFAIRSRIQMEAFLLVFVFAIANQFIPWGAKVFAGGGGYGQALGQASNFFLGNGEILSGLCLASVSMLLFVMKHGQIFPPYRFVRLGYIGLIVLAFATVIGTHSRTGLVAMVVFAAILWATSSRKILYTAVIAVGAIIIAYSAPASWTDRMSTIFASEEDRDGSAAGRLAMWKWTLDFVGEHPFGGGFESWRTAQVVVEVKESKARIDDHLAFHSSLFEVLGEHGWIGLGITFGLIFASFNSLRKVRRMTRHMPHLAWAHDLSSTLFNTLAVQLACGLFTAMAFQPTYYYLFALCFSLREYVRRVLAPAAAGERASLGIESAAALPIAQRPG